MEESAVCKVHTASAALSLLGQAAEVRMAEPNPTLTRDFLPRFPDCLSCIPPCTYLFYPPTQICWFFN
jgi:hypothetical protein